ncbi:hypothetical protein [Bacillus sp. B-jedd]|uniref:hypothetical protein n=1 Tax=Bacillus sp. B-jedd TaxID=1476857 RepID=UPI0005155855|nr:hypothetical protein [Bacillus sp. B-jedd]CEG25868.1 hypothetical protein BN1002_00686 [Bacillus sp. B-jedd]
MDNKEWKLDNTTSKLDNNPPKLDNKTPNLDNKRGYFANKVEKLNNNQQLSIIDWATISQLASKRRQLAS